ncbi:MAG TPA: malto-oligosyltrehalose synthase [Pirellulales bacterium]|nr:malto-oligosyltrehalose synthase [Pirellulales bacterium]
MQDNLRERKITMVQAKRVPLSTYRLQFNVNFGFQAARQLVDYLHDLGISDAYASPLFRACHASTHGYDVVDHCMISPDFGSEEDFRAFAGELARHEMGLLMDVVPNHMGINDPHNRLWQDVLENGPSSPYASFFDIDWNPPKEELKNKVLLPFLGDQYGKVLESQQLKLAYADGAFFVQCYDRPFPLTLRSWARVLELAQQHAVGKMAHDDPQWLDLESILIALRNLPPLNETDPERIHQRQLEREVVPRRIAALVEASAIVREAIDQAVAEFNGRLGEPSSFDRLEQLLAEQAYRLAYWRVAADEINYRRFFDIKELAAIRVELPAVFRTVHQLVFTFLQEGCVTGLRIDHPDGLLDPERYFAHLQEEFCALAGSECPDFNNQIKPHDQLPLYVVAEKILGRDEPLPANWAVSGTTGYDYLNVLNGLFVEGRNAAVMRSLYVRFTGQNRRFRDVAYESKKVILERSMSSELHVLARQLDRISESHRYSRDFTFATLHHALLETIACFPVYRTYVRPGSEPVSDDDRKRIMAALRVAKRRNPETDVSVFDFVRSVLLLDHPPHLTEQQRDERREFVLRFQQLSGPVTAKGIEDTAFYRDYPLLSLCEVGGDPEHFGTSLAEFHRRGLERREQWPHTMLASSTHDTKRSEDVRARINLLSECPEEWEQAIQRWHKFNQSHRSEVDGADAPSPNEEYLIYQTLVGAWPLEQDDDVWSSFIDRIKQYMSKAMKEAKANTSWTNPSEDWEDAVDRFVSGILDRQASREFLGDFERFHAPLAVASMHNALAQLLVKICSPGAPDFYQGTELWDFSLVDPDNRRPVDFNLRRKLLAELKSHAEGDLAALAGSLLANWRDGRIKLYVTYRSLNFRRQHAELFQSGDYVPLEASGVMAEHVCAFARTHCGQAAVAVVPRLVLPLPATGKPIWTADTWGDTSLSLPDSAKVWRNLFTGAQISASDKVRLSSLLDSFPVALLTNA